MVEAAYLQAVARQPKDARPEKLYEVGSQKHC